jgi:hypothetical protein
MRTARSVEEQEERKQARDNSDEAQISPELRQSVRQKHRRGDASRIAAWRFQPGKSGNPGGVPKHDVAKEIAKAIFENNPDMVYKAFAKAIAKGNAYALQVLADRGYGKLKEQHQVEVGPYRDLSDDELRDRIAKLQEQPGLPPHTEEDNAPKPS